MTMTINQLRMLSTVAQRGTIAAAAEAVGYTPSAVSQQLSALEKATGTPVLERVGRSVRLTDAGRELVVHADRLLAGMEEAIAAVERLTTDVRGRLRLSTYESITSTVLPPLLTRLGRDHPDLEVRTTQDHQDQLPLDLVEQGDLDMAFVFDYPHSPEPIRPGITRTRFLDDEYFLIVPVDDAIVGPTVSLPTVADRIFVMPSDSCGQSVIMACRAAGFDPRVLHEHNDYPAALQLVGAGHGVALVPQLGLLRAPDTVRIVPLEQRVTRHVEVAYRTASEDRPAIQAVSRAIAEVVVELGLTGAKAA